MKRKRNPLIILTKQIFSLIIFLYIYFVIKFLDVLLSQPKGEEILTITTTTTTTEIKSISLDIKKLFVSL